jgi:hypothetical protein
MGFSGAKKSLAQGRSSGFAPDQGHGLVFRGSELKFIAANLERQVIEKILNHLGLDPQPPPRGRGREAGKALPPEPRWPSHTLPVTHIAAQGCDAKPQPVRRRATRQRGTIGIRANPEDMVTSEPCER